MAKLPKQPVFDWLNECVGFSCPTKNIEILKCEKSEADKIIINHHYSHKPTKIAFYRLLFYGMERLMVHCNWGMELDQKLKVMIILMLCENLTGCG
jgi:hypothetical protein